MGRWLALGLARGRSGAISITVDLVKSLSGGGEKMMGALGRGRGGNCRSETLVNEAREVKEEA